MNNVEKWLNILFKVCFTIFEIVYERISASLHFLKKYCKGLTKVFVGGLHRIMSNIKDEALCENGDHLSAVNCLRKNLHPVSLNTALLEPFIEALRSRPNLFPNICWGDNRSKGK